VFPDRIDSVGTFATGTYLECAQQFEFVLSRNGYNCTADALEAALTQISDFASCSDSAHYVLICGTGAVFAERRELGLKLALATVDTQASADYFAKRLNLTFDFAEGTISGRAAKPARAPID
jgi:phosphoglycolate phosphatase-like HAD superfamily hydrolase